MHDNDIALIGLAAMGQNLALNMARHGLRVTVHNRTWTKTENFMTGPARGHAILAARDLKSVAASLARPRKIFLMVKAGQAVDDLLDELLPLLEPGDIVMDGGNSHFADTARRVQRLARQGLHFLGVGVSGGEQGALHGPSIMPGGPRPAWEQVAPMLKAIAARADDGRPCTAYMGEDGAGHFVKMVHNGIEYADMQLIAEIYDLLRQSAGLGAADIADTFETWNHGPLQSFLIEITATVLRTTDKDTPLVDLILDKAGSKGTGRWTTQTALDLGVATPTINAAVDARLLSALTTERQTASALLSGPTEPCAPPDFESLGQALFAAKLVSYAQGFALLRAARDTWAWSLDLPQITRVWRAGCIIRAAFLNDLAKAFDTADLPNLLLAPTFGPRLETGQTALRQTVALAARHGIPVPTLAASLAYYDSYRAARLPANLIQAQRDFFGAHRFERIDQPGAFHWDWSAS
ncbi:MAG: NADP-dependent phosphogluconate dehydrogenase [Deltaproteobacteria bacterium]|nr:NADP-dependent phosphogluconate dehydrogenase [Deltaproteobacteria bacterium]